MRINYFAVRNFRSIKSAKVIAQNYSLLVGPNNSGKSHLLRALQFGLTRSVQVTQDDYPARELPLPPVEVEMDFCELTDKEKESFADYLRMDGTLRLVRFASVVNEHPINNGYRVLLDGEQPKDVPEELLKDGILPEFHFVPALFDLARELDPSGNSYFGRLLKRFLPIGLIEFNLGLSAESVSALEAQLSADLAYFGGKIKISAPQLSAEQLYGLGAWIEIDDGAPTRVDRKGHGFQRALIFSFIRQWVNAVRNRALDNAYFPLAGSESVIFAFEEPEQNMHPHGQRKVVADLLDLAAAPNHQVFVCSHSPVFVTLERPESISIVRRSDANVGTTVTQCIGEFFAGEDRQEKVRRFNATAYFNPDRSELFFAEKVVLVEGQTEKKVLPYLAELLGVFKLGVSIIDCDGKYNLRLYMEVLNRFSLPYTVVHDEDPLPENPSGSAIGIFNENQRIAELAAQNGNSVHVCSPDFEGLAEIVKQPNKPFNAFEHFEEKGVEAINEKLKGYVASIYGNAPEVGNPVVAAD